MARRKKGTDQDDGGEVTEVVTNGHPPGASVDVEGEGELTGESLQASDAPDPAPPAGAEPEATSGGDNTIETLAPPAEDDTAEMSVPEPVAAGDTEPIPFALESPPGDAAPGGEEAIEPARLETIIESLLFASDRPLGLADLKRLLGERDGKKVTVAVEALQARRAGTGVVIIAAAGGWQLRTNPEHAPWVGKLLAGKPVRLSRAMLETLAIIAYRQPVTRPEIDEIRAVDCGPVLKTLLDRGLIRIIGKKEEVGRPLLYGTTPEFLRTFSLRDLTELPTLREFHELGRDERALVDAQVGEAPAETAPEGSRGAFTPHPPLSADPEENDGLLDDLDRAAQAAARATESATSEPTNPTTPDGTGSRDGPDRPS
jgi:segregation and condensation protein B